jgi:hypothetical protein
MILVDFKILTFAAVLSGWRDAYAKINPVNHDRRGLARCSMPAVVPEQARTNRASFCRAGFAMA